MPIPLTREEKVSRFMEFGISVVTTAAVEFGRFYWNVSCVPLPAGKVRLPRLEGESIVLVFMASPQQGDLKLLGHLSGQSAGGGARTRDRSIPEDLRADSLATVPPTPRVI
ncbi:hypothetical protein PoB_002843800 [Plakobranchus ocellatus]|uniref:Uncharacterized protein n=1 Tax=Plakobranchus ocellatus TaxID=259542 RepID=A0AAV4A5N4_9GAST|nr:hypothetical protein PoB_002843800 [Plakobranchus ocellatus]